MAQLGVFFIFNAVLQSDEGVRALQDRFHLQCVQLVHIVDLLSVFVCSDDEPSAFFIVDGVPHATHFYGDLVSPAIQYLHEDSGDDNESGSFIDYTVGLVHDK